MRTKSWRIDSSASWATICVPVGPPWKPVAITGSPSVFSIRAMLTPLPPASARRSTVRWRRPSRKLGTESDLSIAALSVTVMIITASQARPPRAPAHDEQATPQERGGQPAARSEQHERGVPPGRGLRERGRWTGRRRGRHERDRYPQPAVLTHLDPPFDRPRGKRADEAARHADAGGAHALARSRRRSSLRAPRPAARSRSGRRPARDGERLAARGRPSRAGRRAARTAAARACPRPARPALGAPSTTLIRCTPFRRAAATRQ